jgi:hypothetical protein
MSGHWRIWCSTVNEIKIFNSDIKHRTQVEWRWEYKELGSHKTQK